MACYKPLVAVYVGTDFQGQPEYKLNGFKSVKDVSFMDKLLPCGQCIGCRLDRSRQWADRMMLELDHSKVASFITLTYDDSHCPVGQVYDDGTVDYSLRKRDWQLFLKRFRKMFSPREIRFYACGEYGDSTHRPHYHAILFGVAVDELAGDVLGYNEFHQPVFKSPILNKVWKNGENCSVAHVSWQTCAYVARYVTKKLTGPRSIEYAVRNIEPEFSLMSRRPGIGGFFALDHPDLLGDSFVYIDDCHGEKNHVKVSMPKYLFSKLELTNPDLYDSIKLQRCQSAHDRQILELWQTDLGLVDYFPLQERQKFEAFNRLKRKEF